MRVSELIEKLQKVKNKDAIIVIEDHKGFDMHFVAELDVIESIADPDDISWDDCDPPEWLPKKPFATVELA